MAVTQMTEKTLNAEKGWPHQAAVDYHAKFADSVFDLVDRVEQGSCVHLNASGEYELGVGTLEAMPMFTFQASDDPDVSNDGGDPATKKGAFLPISPSGNVMALVAIGAYELVSTAYDTDNPGDYVINALLTSPVATDLAGKLVIGDRGTDTICGQISQGLINNGYGYSAVAFWPLVIYPD